MSDRNIELMAHGKIYKAVNYMMLPATTGLLVNGLYNVVDTMFVAWLGTYATGATQVVMPVMVLISAFGLCLGVGAGSYVSRLLGMKDYRKANQVGTTAVATAVILGLALSILLLLFLSPILRLFGAEDTTMVYAMSYGKYIAVSAVFTVTSITLNNLLRAEGSATLSMIGQGSGAIINIILDPILIFYFGMGIEGAAIATLFARIVTTVILLSRYFTGKSVLKLAWKHINLSLDIYREVLKIGISTFSRQLFYTVSLGIMNNVAVAYGGQTLLAAVGILLRITLLINFLMFGISQGMQPVVGYNYGAGNWLRVKEAFRYTMIIAFAVSLVCAFMVMVFDRQVIGIFRPEEPVMAYAVVGLRFYGVTYVLMSFISIVTAFFQAIGKSLESLILSVTRQGIVFIPVVILLPIYVGDMGILSAQLVADLLTLIITVLLFRPYFRQLVFSSQIKEGESNA